ncbi:hypothetical protein A2215_01005 [Candidatus Berkelbacteria bacterium RIFOXYA2_FULL_43_10]|uniref:DUF5698 domain-containing protein n=1 Tax=Candidatus Berkelbacteria bacterium RIFOXYA2_FULL_43_10 TaxID=1797472 RepID=A0A1F5ED29_9BACT|nr:MAG: hypothetical protein A2215_01005 [Candidatus Berkelbacteria bacterium RIFOXYA2_FULL_43_10]
MYYLILFYLAGVLQDFLLTLNWRFIAKERTAYAVLFSFLTTVISMLVIYNIITRLDSDRSIIAILIYALGIATGTLIAMKVKIGEK